LVTGWPERRGNNVRVGRKGRNGKNGRDERRGRNVIYARNAEAFLDAGASGHYTHMDAALIAARRRSAPIAARIA
jgi:hypothetical protein